MVYACTGTVMFCSFSRVKQQLQNANTNLNKERVTNFM